MRSLVLLGSCLLLLALFGVSTAADVPPASPDPQDRDAFHAAGHPISEELPSLAKADGDTIVLFGGALSLEGKFEDATHTAPDMQGWLGVDETDVSAYWHVDTFNASNLHANGPGNRAMWCGKEDPTWVHSPGYGNNWNDILIWSSGPLPDPGIGQTVGLDFYFNHDVEAGWDYFLVEYDSAGFWKEIYAVDGDNHDASGVFPAPGVQFSTAGASPIVFVGSDYGGETGEEIVIRMRVLSDTGYSDEDGLNATVGGAAQVDDITVTYQDGAKASRVVFEDFEGATFAWNPMKPPFAGEFAKVFPRFNDIDPCRSNETPVMTFIDDGTPPANGGGVSTGGTTSINWSYGVPGGWVVNYNGGLSFGEVGLLDTVQSPVIAWDAPGSIDDGVEWAGARESHIVWGHLPLLNGIFWSVEIRCSLDAGVTWTGWRRPDNGGLWYGGPSWYVHDMDISEVLEPGLTHLQMRFAVRDLAAAYNLPGNDATPAPVLDNVTIKKHVLLGPVMATDGIFLANDGFPVNGSIDVSTLASRDALDIPFDRVADGSTGDLNVPGDSLTVDVKCIIPGTALSDTRMVWFLEKNPLFEDAIRAVPARPQDQNVDTATYAGAWYGEVVGQQCFTSSGILVEDKYLYDLPDVDFFYPGDKIRYYIQSTDSGNRTTTFPRDTSGFFDGVGYDPSFAIKGLPSIRDAAGTQPSILFVNDFGFRGGTPLYANAFGQNGYVEGVDYDIYNVTRPDNTWNGNGLGSAGAHGANPDQLRNYHVMFYETGNLSSQLLSDGSDDGSNQKDDTIGCITAWFAQSADRGFVAMGDNLASGTSAASTAGAVFVNTLLGVDVQDNNVRDEIDGQTTPLVDPILSAFATQYVAYGGCLGVNLFDSIRPLAPAVRGHAFLDRNGVPIPDVAASVVHSTNVNGFQKDALSFPHSMVYVYTPVAKADGRSMRAIWLQEIIDYFGNFPPSGTVVGIENPPERLFSEFEQYPNPFNPATTIRFRLGAKSQTSVRVFNLRGELVREIENRVLEPGVHSYVWKGIDGAGASVASGVYLLEVKGPEFHRAKKVALVR